MGLMTTEFSKKTLVRGCRSFMVNSRNCKTGGCNTPYLSNSRLRISRNNTGDDLVIVKRIGHDLSSEFIDKIAVVKNIAKVKK